MPAAPEPSLRGGAQALPHNAGAPWAYAGGLLVMLLFILFWQRTRVVAVVKTS